jgi:4-amino-4-deoxy-L-arabinose transferase-like glycosyltransferase
MISERTYPGRAHPKEHGLTISLNRYWDRIGLGLILALAAVLNFYGLSREGYANTYYAAAVKSMLQNWHAFFFNSLDSAGFVTLDKPPLGFWLQVASAKVFGYSGVALMLPQALAGVLSVALLYYLVSRIFGKPAGLIAALALAITPISVVVNRNNTIDSTLVLAVLLGAWAVSRAVETGKLRWLLLCAVFVGLGFNIKMLQAYLVLPAFGLMYLLGVRIGWRKRIVHLVLAAVMLLVVSLSWVTAVDLTPASQRPWVGSTTNNSELSLALGYNGLERLTGNSSVGVGGVGENGPTGVLRLLDTQLGGQIGWWLPLAVIGFAVAVWQTRRRRWPLSAKQSALVLWGMWLLTMDIFFDIAGFYHTYYLVMVAPATAALSGIGIVSLWRAYRAPGSKTWWLLPASLPAVAAIQVHLLSDYPAWARWLDPLILGLAILGALVLIVLRLRPTMGIRPKIAALVIGLAALLAAPAAWSVDSVYAANSGNLPTAGPSASSGTGRFAFGGGRGSFRPPNGSFSPPGGGSGSGPQAFGRSGAPGGRFGAPGGHFGAQGSGGSGGNQVNKTLLTYLEAHQGKATYLFATTNVHTAAAYIIGGGKAVMALGGFTGSDPILTTTQLTTLATERKVKYFLLSGGGTGGPGASSSLTTWIQHHAKLITVGGTQLYQYTG